MLPDVNKYYMFTPYELSLWMSLYQKLDNQKLDYGMNYEQRNVEKRHRFVI